MLVAFRAESSISFYDKIQPRATAASQLPIRKTHNEHDR
jgi:hypothetical protein